MNVLVIGSGGREHALCWKLRQSSKVTRVFCAPGNPGIGRVAELVPLKADDLQAQIEFARRERIDLTVVGPEYPLSLGVVDLFRSQGLRIFGPTKAAAQLESSKSFAKEIMHAAGVPSAGSAVFGSAQEAAAYIEKKGAPIVLKADGLAAGKGVHVCADLEQARAALKSLFGELKSSRVVVEDYLRGEEVSYIVATDGEIVIPCASSHDYKRIFDADEGPNTGGMGSVSPTPRLSGAQEPWVIEHVITPVIREMARRGSPFCGFLYAGLMLQPGGQAAVLEFNARMGDPECQSIMRRMHSDLFELLFALAEGRRRTQPPPAPRWRSESAVCLVLAAQGYPGAAKSGDEITGIESAETLPEVVVFHAGTRFNEQQRLVTGGGRVLNVTALGADLAEARARAYRAADMIQFSGRQLRRDICLR